MNAALGNAGIYAALLASVVGALIVLFGIVRNRPSLVRQTTSCVVVMLAGAVLATAAMQSALLGDDFSIQYVADNHSTSTPLLFTISTMWAALEGSILLWGLVLAGFLASMTWRFRKRLDEPIVAWASVVGFIVATYFFALLAGPANPFVVVDGPVPVEGPGPNPLLQNHPLMAIHPPMLYLGYVGFTVPFAFAIAALITGRVDRLWMVETRRWTLVAWTFLTAGIVLGAWWSYEVLGWGGYWAWDPVENASLLPWLTATAFLHSVMSQERRGMFRVWNLALITSTFALTILGTFFTRSGVLDSVHAFSESPLGPVLLGAFAVITAVTCGLIFWRANLLGTEGSISTPWSREAAFLGNNLAFAAFALVVLLGTVFPLIAETIDGSRLTIGRSYFDTMTTPIGLVLLFLMAVGPFLRWKGGSARSLFDQLQIPIAIAVVVLVASVVLGARGVMTLLGITLGAFVIACASKKLAQRVKAIGPVGLVDRSGGGMIAHIGFAIVAIAIVVSTTTQTSGELVLRAGESGEVGGHNFTFESLSAEQSGNGASTVAAVRIDGGDVYEPALSLYPNSSDAIGTPSVRTSIHEDIYLTLIRTPAQAGEPVVIGVLVNPATLWLWVGGALIVLGGTLSLISRPTSRKETTVPSEVASG
jgi:cytochrome c-type biogenesis protein CcmF